MEAEAPRKANRKFRFFKFKGFGSLSNLPRSFTLRRSAPTISIRSYLQPDTFETTQDDMVTIPMSPPPYARSSDMYSHMGTMPRPSIKKARDRRAISQARQRNPEPHLGPPDQADTPRLEAAKEEVVAGTTAPTPAAGTNPSDTEEDPTEKEKPKDPEEGIAEDMSLNMPPER